jgi:hypothetical protein
MLLSQKLHKIYNIIYILYKKQNALEKPLSPTIIHIYLTWHIIDALSRFATLGSNVIHASNVNLNK